MRTRIEVAFEEAAGGGAADEHSRREARIRENWVEFVEKTKTGDMIALTKHVGLEVPAHAERMAASHFILLLKSHTFDVREVNDEEWQSIVSERENERRFEVGGGGGGGAGAGLPNAVPRVCALGSEGARSRSAARAVNVRFYSFIQLLV